MGTRYEEKHSVPKFKGAKHLNYNDALAYEQAESGEHTATVSRSAVLQAGDTS